METLEFSEHSVGDEFSVEVSSEVLEIPSVDDLVTVIQTTPDTQSSSTRKPYWRGGITVCPNCSKSVFNQAAQN